jgi:hypothetical protein
VKASNLAYLKLGNSDAHFKQRAAVGCQQRTSQRETVPQVYKLLTDTELWAEAVFVSGKMGLLLKRNTASGGKAGHFILWME